MLHATSPSWSEPPGAGRFVATAIYANKQALGASEAYLKRGDINESFFLEHSAISEEILKDPRVVAVLQLPSQIERY